MKKSELITLIKQIVRDINKEKELLYDDEEPIEEISTSGAAGAYDTPNAFSKTGNIDGKKFEKDGMTLAKHTEVWSKSADQIQKAEKKARKNSPIKIKEDIDPPDNEIKNGDKVYWNIMVGYYPRRISGVVQSIKNGIATVKQTTQNTDGKFTLKAVNKLIKSKDQERYQKDGLPLSEGIHTLDMQWIIKNLKTYCSSKRTNFDLQKMYDSIMVDLNVKNKELKSQLIDHISASLIDIDEWKQNDYIGFARELIRIVNDFR
jgi:hypothetical protein